MDMERKKTKKLTVVLFLSCICIALVCFGIFGYIVLIKQGGGVVSPRLVTISKIFVMTGIFFIVLAFGHLLPVLISHMKHERERRGI